MTNEGKARGMRGKSLSTFEGKARAFLLQSVSEDADAAAPGWQPAAPADKDETEATWGKDMISFFFIDLQPTEA